MRSQLEHNPCKYAILHVNMGLRSAQEEGAPPWRPGGCCHVQTR
jgi:hypothetical protein